MYENHDNLCCPNCGSNDVDVQLGLDNRYHAICAWCACEGEAADSPSEAMDSWGVTSDEDWR